MIFLVKNFKKMLFKSQTHTYEIDISIIGQLIRTNMFEYTDDYYLLKRKQKQLKRRFIEKTVSTCFLQEIVHDWIWVVKCK